MLWLGLGRLDSSTVTMEDVIPLIERKRKKVAMGKTGRKSLKSSSKVEKPKRTKTAYQLFVSEKIKEEKMKLGDAAAAWKALDQAGRDVFIEKAKQTTVKPLTEDLVSGQSAKSETKAKEVKKKTKKDAKKKIDKTKATKGVRKMSAYQMFMKEKMSLKKGSTLAEVALEWKELTEDDKAKYVSIAADASSDVSTESVAGKRMNKKKKSAVLK